MQQQRTSTKRRVNLIGWIVKVRYYSICRDHVSFFPLQKKREKTGEDVTILVNMDNIVSCDVLASFLAIKIILLLNCHLEVLMLFRVFQLNPLIIIVTANIQVN